MSLFARLVLTGVVAAAALLVKGATVFFYADRYPTIDDVDARELD